MDLLVLVQVVSCLTSNLVITLLLGEPKTETDGNNGTGRSALPIDGAKVVQEGWPDAVCGIHGRIAIRLGGVTDGIPCAFRAPACGDTNAQVGPEVCQRPGLVSLGVP